MVLSTAMIGILVGCAKTKVKPALKTETIEERNRRMAWWHEAKFGMFIHWGLYAIPAGVWKGKEIEETGEWIMANADIPVKDYEKIAGQFNPIQFNPDEWVRLAKDAGMRYMVITSKHHDGFCLFDSKVTNYDVVDATPYKRDILKALSKACQKVGIKFCVYYSILDWHHPAQEKDTTQEELVQQYSQNLVKEGQKETYVDYMKEQLLELVTQYDPAILWFDGGWPEWWTPKDGRNIMDFLWLWKPDLIINNRAAGNEEMEKVLGDYLTPEQFIPEKGLQKDWESCMTMNDTWGYKKNDHNWKSTQVLIINLVDVVSKGGNLLLNVGPTAEGLIPQPSIDRLMEIGKWLKINGEAIYGANMWRVYKEGHHDVITDYYDNELQRVVPFTSQDIRFTAKDNVVYGACLAWPEEKLEIKSLGKKSMPDVKILAVNMLGSDEKLKWTLGEESLTIIPPKKKACDYVYVFKITLQ